MRVKMKTLKLLLIVGLVIAGCDRVVDPAQQAETSETQAFSVEQSFAKGSCDVTVPNDYSTIQDAIDNATVGETVCVRPGTYEEEISVNKGIILRGVNSANSGNPAVIDGWISLDAGGAELYRVVVTRSDQIDAPSPIDTFGIRVMASNTVVADNIVRGLSGESQNWGAINGIQVFGGSSISNITIENNEIHDFENQLLIPGSSFDVVGGVAGIKLQADLTDVNVVGNSISNLHSAGWGWGIVLQTSGSADGVPKNVHVERNSVSEVNDGSIFGDDQVYPGSAFGIDGGALANEVTLIYNNLLAQNGAESKDQVNTLDATCNWWGDRSGPTHDDNPGGEGAIALERGSASIDFEPWLISPSPGKACRGRVNKQPGNTRR